MRIHRLEVAGIGPFRTRQVIDVDQLSRSGLFLIEGPTGSGKSTLIDALSFALYGSVGDRDVRSLRSHHCRPEDPSEVVLEFSVRGRRHRIRRSPEYQRPKERGTGLTTQRATQVLEEFADDGSVVVAMREAREIGSHVAEALGMGAAQFRQLIVLPQGAFDRLLRASPRDRLDVLAHLIDDGLLEAVQDELRTRADAAAEQRETAEAEIARARATLDSRLAEASRDLGIDPTQEPAVGPDDVDDAGDIAARLAARLAALRVGAEQATEAAATAAEAARAAEASAAEQERQLGAARAAGSARAAVAAAERALDPVDRAAVAATGDVEAAVRDVTAERSRIEHLVAWAREAPERAREIERLRGAHDEAVRAAQELRATAERLPTLRADLDRRRLETERMAARLAEIRARLRAVEDLLAVRDTLRECRTAVADSTAASLSAEERLIAAREARVTAAEEVLDLTRRQWQQRAAHLAADLDPGTPCPVCGATEHPAPAVPGAEPPVRPADIDTAAQAERDAAADVAEAEREARERAADRARLSAQEAELVAREAALAVPDAPAALTTLRADEEQAVAAAAGIDSLAAEQRDLEERERTLARDLEALLATAESTRLAVVEQESTDAERERARAAVLGTESAPAAHDRLTRRLTALSALLESERALRAVGPVPETDPGELERTAAAARGAADAAAAAASIALGRAERLTSTVTATSDLAAELDRAERTAATIRASTDDAIALGDLVTARSRANLRRLTLHSYAVQRRFAAVLDAASIHLERMSGGKYSLELNEEGSRGQTGLGIAVLDAWTGERRDPATLSGGETFYASLALALGLADIVREETGGADLETLIVDEGFGSLDADSLQQVLDQLDALRSRGRTVAVVSHVADMRDWVHDRLEIVVDADRTSRVRAPEPDSESHERPAPDSDTL